MIDRNDDTSLGIAEPIDDSMVYIPLEEVPDGLLDKLPDFKVVVRDKQGDRILPKERLGEVLETMDSAGSPVRKRRSPEITTQKATHNHSHHQQSPRHSINPRASSPSVLQQHSPKSLLGLSGLSYELPATSPATQVETHRRQKDRAYGGDTNRHQSFTEESVCRKKFVQSPNSKDFDHLSERSLTPGRLLNKGGRCLSKDCDCSSSVTMDTEFESEALRSFLETTPRKVHPNSIPLFLGGLETGECTHDIYVSNQPVIQQQKQHINQRLPQTADIRSARKQLFTRGDYQKQKFDDQLSPAKTCRCCECPDNTYFHSPRKGLKRKYSECEEEVVFCRPSTRRSRDGPITSDGVAEYLLQHLHSSQRLGPGYDDDIGPLRTENTPPNCACSLMKSHFLRMTECAYLNIRRHDCTSGSFDQFRKELTETNSVLQESVRMLRSIQQICTHNNYHDR